MRTSLSQLENIYDLSATPDDEKPRREIHRRTQKVFDLHDAQVLKVTFEKIEVLFFLNNFKYRMKLINHLKVQLENFQFLKNMMKQKVK